MGGHLLLYGFIKTRGGKIGMLKSTRKLVKLLRALPKVKINDDEKFMKELFKKIRRENG